MGMSMLNGKSWETIAKTIPGFRPFEYNKFIYCGLREVCDESKQRVAESGTDVIWGNP